MAATYCIDTSCLIAAWEERYPIDNFPNFWNLLDRAIQAGRIVAPQAVHDRSVAHAALDGQLDAARLRGMPRETALKELKTLPGIGDFSAGLILLRGAGDPDAVAYHEPRLALAVADAYGLPGPATTGQLTEISENWRPYRTWVTAAAADPAGNPGVRRVTLGLARGCA